MLQKELDCGIYLKERKNRQNILSFVLKMHSTAQVYFKRCKPCQFITLELPTVQSRICSAGLNDFI